VTHLRCALLLAVVAACGQTGGGNPDAGSPDAGRPDAGRPDAGPVDAGPSVCGHPGDVGNSKGIGKYCTLLMDCPYTAPICSDIANDPLNSSLHTFFCVLPCDQCSPADFCGEGASCVCQAPDQCGCTPNTCQAIFPDAGNPPCERPDAGNDGGQPDAGDAG
jgi:hypothetical protein